MYPLRPKPASPETVSIGCHNDHHSIWPEEAAGLRQEVNRIGHVFNHVVHSDNVERSLWETLERTDFDPQTVFTAGDFRSHLVKLQTGDCPTKLAHPPQERAASASNIKQSAA
jgi:hypothetical protein